VREQDVDAVIRRALEPFDRGGTGEGPYQLQHVLEETMQELVGIVRREEEMQRALKMVVELKARSAHVGVSGNREFNPGWHTALDLRHLLTVSEAITRSAIDRKESRGGHFRDDFPEKSNEYGAFNIVVKKGQNGDMQLERVPIPPTPPELKAIIEEMK
jgi:succinate dehydrogenase / fumarate reductase flavoprotein subunit